MEAGEWFCRPGPRQRAAVLDGRQRSRGPRRSGSDEQDRLDLAQGEEVTVRERVPTREARPHEPCSLVEADQDFGVVHADRERRLADAATTDVLLGDFPDEGEPGLEVQVVVTSQARLGQDEAHGGRSPQLREGQVAHERVQTVSGTGESSGEEAHAPLPSLICSRMPSGRRRLYII
jgi:hypothetical protein